MATYKPSDLFIGLVDLLAVLLPGVILAFWARPLAEAYLLGTVLSVPPAPEAQALVFATAAVFLGHLAYGLGAGLEDAWRGLRKRLRKPTQPSEHSYIRRAITVLTELGHNDADASSKMYCSILVAKRSERAAGEIERLYALTRFFRSFAAVFLVIIAAGGTPNERAILAWSTHGGSLLLVGSLFIGAFVAYLLYRSIHEKAVYRSVLALFTPLKEHSTPPEKSPRERTV